MGFIILASRASKIRCKEQVTLCALSPNSFSISLTLSKQWHKRQRTHQNYDSICLCFHLWIYMRNYYCLPIVIKLFLLISYIKNNSRLKFLTRFITKNTKLPIRSLPSHIPPFPINIRLAQCCVWIFKASTLIEGFPICRTWEFAKDF